jgi:hypothetical protein
MIYDRARPWGHYIPGPFSQFHFFVKRGGNTDGYWEEGFRVQGEWNNHEHRRKEGVLGEWKIPFDV